jgi:hypothetical protein
MAPFHKWCHLPYYCVSRKCKNFVSSGWNGNTKLSGQEASYIVFGTVEGCGVKRRVVITGMGTVSPNGVGNAAFSEAVLEGKSGIRRITRFDPSEILVQIAGEVPDFDELAWVEKRDRKHVSRVLPLALAAATEALRTAEIDTASLPLEQKRRFGVILGSGGGSQEFTEEQYLSSLFRRTHSFSSGDFRYSPGEMFNSFTICSNEFGNATGRIDPGLVKLWFTERRIIASACLISVLGPEDQPNLKMPAQVIFF